MSHDLIFEKKNAGTDSHILPSGGELACKIGDKFYIFDTPLYHLLSNVYRDKMLKGTVAVTDSNVIAGSIPTVAASSDGEKVTVPWGYIAEEQSFPLSVSSIFDLVKVTEYIPYAPEVTAVTSVVVSGMGTFGDGEEDVTAANGTYLVTAETAGESDWKRRVYKHESADYYLYHHEDPDYPEDAYWQFGYDTDSSFLTLYSSEDIASGENDWHNEDWGEGFTLTLTCTTVTTPEQPLVLKGVKATGYTDDGWTFSSSETSFSGFEYTPKTSWIYATANNKLIGQPIAYAMDVPAGTVFLFNKTLTDVVNNTTVINYGLTASGTGIVCAEGKYAEIPANSLPSDVMCDDKPWTFEIRFRCLDVTAWTEEYLCPFGRGIGPRFDVLITKTTVHVGGINELEVTADLADGEWHIYKITHTSENVFTAYLDGKVSDSTTTTKTIRTADLWIGHDGESRYAAPLEIEYIRIGNTVEV